MGKLSQVFSPPKIKDASIVLCVQPHPDDNEIGMGGSIAEYVKRGCEVCYLTVCNGDYGAPDPKMSRAQTAELRRAETRAAGELLGVKRFYALEHGDCELSDIPALAAEIARVIKQVKPEVVFCPDGWAPYEAHNDHVIVGRATALAFALTGLPNFPDEGGAPHESRAIAFYYTNKPNTVINITRSFDKKRAAIAEHKSQISEQTLADYTMFFKLLGFRTAFWKPFFLGEGFKVLSPLQLHCFPYADRV